MSNFKNWFYGNKGCSSYLKLVFSRTGWQRSKKNANADVTCEWTFRWTWNYVHFYNNLQHNNIWNLDECVLLTKSHFVFVFSAMVSDSKVLHMWDILNKRHWKMIYGSHFKAVRPAISEINYTVFIHICNVFVFMWIICFVVSFGLDICITIKPLYRNVHICTVGYVYIYVHVFHCM